MEEWRQFCNEVLVPRMDEESAIVLFGMIRMGDLPLSHPCADVREDAEDILAACLDQKLHDLHPHNQET